MWTNNRDFHNNLIPYEFTDMAALCMNGNRPYDDFLDHYADSSELNMYCYGIRNFEKQSEILAHLRVRAEEPTRPYTLKMNMCCTNDHKMYRAYWTIEWKS